MSYYQRPMGDYRTYGYAGDPGFLSSLWKGVKKIAGPVLGGIIGGPIGAVVGGLGTGGKAVTPAVQQPVQGIGGPVIGGTVGFPGGLNISGGLMVPGKGRLPPFTATGPGVLPAGGRGGGVVPSGYHFAKDGSGRLVRNRRMNVANPKALRRSLRRVQGFEKLVRRTFTVSGSVKPKRGR